MGILKDLKFGLILSRLTSVFEKIESFGFVKNIGSFESLFSLTPRERHNFTNDIKKLRNWPRHEVTRELLKNGLLAERLGRPSRYRAIGYLLEFLIEHEVALDAEEFLKSYG